MALERRNPLPPNARYWVDLAPADQSAFDSWLRLNNGSVAVVSTSRDDGWDFVMFDVKAPLVWWQGPGFPSIAPAGATRETDVKQIPVIETPEAADVIRTGAIALGAIVLAAVALNRVLR